MDRFCCICKTPTKPFIKDIEDYEYKIFGSWSYDLCPSCKILQLNPFPKDLNEVSSFYPKNYHNFRKSKLFNFLNTQILNYRIRSLKFNGGENLRVIDVGAGDAKFLETLTEKKDVDKAIAIDIGFSKDLNFNKISFTSTPFVDTSFEIGSFDAVFMNNYLEHTLNPLSELKKAHSYLRTTGFIFGVLPNFDSYDRQFFKRYWGGMHTPRHLFHLDKESLTKLLQSAGFTKIDIKNELHPGHISISINNYLIKKFSLNGPRVPFLSFLTVCLLPLSVLSALFSKNGSMKFRASK